MTRFVVSKVEETSPTVSSSTPPAPPIKRVEFDQNVQTLILSASPSTSESSLPSPVSSSPAATSISSHPPPLPPPLPPSSQLQQQQSQQHLSSFNSIISRSDGWSPQTSSISSTVSNYSSDNVTLFAGVTHRLPALSRNAAEKEEQQFQQQQQQCIVDVDVISDDNDNNRGYHQRPYRKNPRNKLSLKSSNGVPSKHNYYGSFSDNYTIRNDDDDNDGSENGTMISSNNRLIEYYSDDDDDIECDIYDDSAMRQRSKQRGLSTRSSCSILSSSASSQHHHHHEQSIYQRQYDDYQATAPIPAHDDDNEERYPQRKLSNRNHNHYQPQYDYQHLRDNYEDEYDYDSDYQEESKQDGRHNHHHPYHPPTTLYRSGSVSIVNCEYKLQEKYPHLIYLIFFVLIYIMLIMFGASLFTLFEAKAELRLRDQIIHTQQLFLEINSCVDPNDLRQFVKAIMAANDKGVNLAKLNELLEIEAMKAAAEPVPSVSSNSSLNSADETLPNRNSLLQYHSNHNSGSNNENKRQTIISSSSSSAKKSLADNQDLVTSFVSDKNREAMLEDNPQAAIPPGSSKAQTDAEITITRHAKPLKVPMEMANWEFLSSLTYVTTVVTTIGYGHVSPATNAGKILTLIFGSIAIPATLLFFSIIISTIRDGPIKAFEIWLIRVFARFSRITLLKIRFIHLLLVTLMLFVTLMLMPAIVYVQLEPDWTFLDSIYYCFITITTVGLGDYVPGQTVSADMSSRPLYLIGTVLYMYIGLCMIMLWIALVLRIPYFNFKTFLVIEEPEIAERKLPNEGTRLLHTIHDEDDDDEDSIAYATIY